MTQQRPKILVARKIFAEGLARLQALCDIDYNESDTIYPSAVLAEKLARVQGALVTGSERIDATTLARAQTLKIVSNMMVGYNNFDLPAMSAAGVMATNTPDVLTDTTADLAFGLILSTARRMAESEHWLRAGHWQNWALAELGTGSMAGARCPWRHAGHYRHGAYRSGHRQARCGFCDAGAVP